ncbi:MAG: AMP-binding protein [Syntrophorhabdales bacterium]
MALTKTWFNIFEETADAFPEGEALVFLESNQRFTYSQYKKKVKEIAKGLYAIGVRKGTHVGIWMTNRPEWIFTRLAVYQLGAIMVPFHTRYRIEEMKYVLGQSDTEVLVMERSLVGKIGALEMLTELIPELRGKEEEKEDLKSDVFPALKKVVLLDEKKHPGVYSLDEVVGLGKSFEDEQIAVRHLPQDTIHIIYTSGTTGFPKGVVTPNSCSVSHDAIYAELCSLTPRSRFLNLMPFFGNIGLDNQAIPLLVGATLVVGPSRFDAEQTMKVIQEEKVTYCIFVPTMLLDILNHPRFKDYDLGSFERITCSGAVVPQTLIQAVKEKMGIYLMNIYGLSEASGLSTWVPYADTPQHIEKSVGLPMPHCELAIRDLKTGEVLPSGLEGEICTREVFLGSQHMKGYYKKPGLTAETIKDGWLYSGDLGRMDEDGYVYLTGRVKEMFTVGGFNVSPPEIENYILRHPAVAGVAVAGIPDKRLGEVCGAFIKLKKGETATADEIIDFCRDKIADIKVPRHVFFVDEFPMNPQGKIQKFKLREKAITNLGLKE